jgi:ribosomal protein S18 acetylase RimI-like enzyme
MASVSVEKADQISEADLDDLCDVAETAIIDGGGFGWLEPPRRDVLERYWRGVILVPERDLFLGRLDGSVAGSAQLVRPTRNNEARASTATMTTHFVAPWARRKGLGRALALAVEEAARAAGFWFLELDVRETQEAAIRLYESLGFERWGMNPNYAIVSGQRIAGHYFCKTLRHLRGKRGRDEEADVPPPAA